jgi:hypothetical protein
MIMNLLCPNCQKMLTVPEQYAGQLMKCPLCSGTFTVPALPGAPPVEPAPAFASPPPAPPPSSSPVANAAGSPSPEANAPVSSVSPGAPAPPPMHESYGLKVEPEPAFRAQPPVETPAFSPAPPEPAFSLGMPATAPAPLAPAPSPGPTAPVSQPVPAKAPAAGYSRTLTIWFSDRVLKWVPPIAVLLIFVLQFLPWVGVYPGGVPAITQNAWQAGFSGATVDNDMKDLYPVISEEDVKKSSESRSEKSSRSHVEVPTKPGVSVLTLFYLLPFFLVTLIVTLAVGVLPFIKTPLPPQVGQLLPWRWVIVAGLNALLLLFLGLQLLLNFDVESKADAWIHNQPQANKDVSKLGTLEVKQRDAFIGERETWIQRTIWLRLAVLLHILATAAAAIVYGIEKRGPSKPLPRLELMW